MRQHGLRGLHGLNGLRVAPRRLSHPPRVIPTSPVRRALRSSGGRVLLRLFWVTLALALAAAVGVWLWSMPEGAVVWPWQLSQSIEVRHAALDPGWDWMGVRSCFRET